MNENKPKIAVLMAAYNGEKWIKKQIDSIFSQENVLVDLYISLDLSNDNSLLIIKDSLKKHSNLFLLPYGKKFGCAAKNFFRLINEVDISSYDYVAFADQDDIWLSAKLIHSINTMKTREADAYSADAIAFWPDNKKKLVKKSYPQKKYDFMFESAGPGFTYVFSIKSFLEFQEFTTSNLDIVLQLEHDWLAYSYFRSKGYKWIIDNIPMVYYRQHDNNQFGANVSLSSYKHRLNLITNGWYANQVRTIVKILELPSVNKRFIFSNLLDTRRKITHAMSMLVFMLFFK